MNNQRVVIVQEASKSLSTSAVKRVLFGLSMKNGDKLRLLGIIWAFKKKNEGLLSIRCGSIPMYRPKLHSSQTINRHRRDIVEEIQKTLHHYLNCPEYKEIMKMVERLQIDFEVVVEAGELNEVSLGYAKVFRATHVILHRKFKKESKYFIENLSCGISRIKFDNTIEIIRPSQLDDIASTSGTGHQINSNQDFREQWRDAERISICSSCMTTRPWHGPKKRFTCAEIQLATNGFSSENLMPDHGRKTYLGVLNDQRKALIREIPSVTIKEEEFRRVVQILGGIGHENVALLLGSCCEGLRRFMVYEYVCCGSLNKHLSSKTKNLTWERRIIIAYGAAKGLEYLHREGIFGSIRPSNILITHDYHPLLSYYGLATHQYEVLGQSSETTVMKTFEYLAPEYEETGIDLSKADVYAFGVVLLELITGRKTIEETEGQSFLRWARPLLKQKKYMELIDPVFQDSVDLHQLYWMVRVAEKCLIWDPKSRYSIQKVVVALTNIINNSSVEDFSPTDSEIMSRRTK